MKFLQLTLENFRGIKQMDIDFQGADIHIVSTQDTMWTSSTGMPTASAAI